MAQDTTFIELKDGSTSITFDWKMLNWKYTSKKLFIFTDNHEFNFPIRQISSIRHAENSNFSTKGFIIGFIFALIGLGTIWFGIGIVFLGLAGFIFYKIFTKTAGIKIFTSWWDNEFIEISNSQKNIAKDLIDIVNKKISEI